MGVQSPVSRAAGEAAALAVQRSEEFTQQQAGPAQSTATVVPPEVITPQPAQDEAVGTTAGQGPHH